MTLSPTAAPPGLMLRLREQTRPHHTAAESHPLQRAMVTGQLPRPLYVAYLGQLTLVHRALDAGLTTLANADERAGRIVSPEQFQTPFLREDLKFFATDEKSIAACSGTVDLLSLVADLRAASPVGLLGLHYVLLGSTNGGRFIAKAVRRAFGLQSAGVRYLDPWGDDQPRIWQHFKHQVDTTVFSPSECDLIVDSAQRMFDGIGQISTDLWSTTGAEQ